MTDHGSQYYGTHPNSKQENHTFRATLDVLGIKHSLARVNRPQTNGESGKVLSNIQGRVYY